MPMHIREQVELPVSVGSCVYGSGVDLTCAAGSVCCASWQDRVSLAAVQVEEVEAGRSWRSMALRGHGEAEESPLPGPEG